MKDDVDAYLTPQLFILSLSVREDGRQDGPRITAHRTYEGAEAYLAAFCRPRWEAFGPYEIDDDTDERVTLPVPTDDDDVIEGYFHEDARDGYTIQSYPVRGDEAKAKVSRQGDTVIHDPSKRPHV